MPTAPFDLSPLHERNALVTGASGFIGTHLCRMLRRHGFMVHALNRRAKPDQPDRQWIVDATDMGALRKLFTEVRPDYVFHLASHVSGSRDLSVVMPTFRDNLNTTVNLLTLATEFGCKRIVLAGSLEEAATGSVAEIVPASPYAVAKLSSTLYARMFHSLYQTPVVAARIFMVYGPGQRDLKKLVPYVIVSLLSGKSPRLGSGTRPVDWVYVDDVAEGLVRAALAPNVVGKSVDLGTGEMTLVRTVTERLGTIIKSGAAPLIGALPDRPLEQVRAADAIATEAAIGFAPKTSLDAGLRQTVEWYRDKLRTKEIDPTSL